MMIHRLRTCTAHLSAISVSTFFVLGLGLAQQVWANTSTHLDLSQVEVTPHELALTQVLAEICPPMLNQTQRQKFTQAYQAQLKEFLPNLNTTLAMQQISSQKYYKNILKSIRTWTLSYPKEENKALCIEFAESQQTTSSF